MEEPFLKSPFPGAVRVKLFFGSTEQKVVTFYRLVGHLGSSGVIYRYTDGLQ